MEAVETGSSGGTCDRHWKGYLPGNGRSEPLDKLARLRRLDIWREPEEAFTKADL